MVGWVQYLLPNGRGKIKTRTVLVPTARNPHKLKKIYKTCKHIYSSNKHIDILCRATRSINRENCSRYCLFCKSFDFLHLICNCRQPSLWVSHSLDRTGAWGAEHGQILHRACTVDKSDGLHIHWTAHERWVPSMDKSDTEPVLWTNLTPNRVEPHFHIKHN